MPVWQGPTSVRVVLGESQKNCSFGHQARLPASARAGRRPVGQGGPRKIPVADTHTAAADREVRHAAAPVA